MVGVIRKIKMVWMHLCSFVLRLVGVRGSGPAGYAIDDICGDAGEMVSDFNGSIGS